MKILLVAATKEELDPVSGIEGSSQHEFTSLVTGPGMVATAFFMGRKILSSFDLAINIGVCGSFRKKFSPGDVLNIFSDGFPEMGAEDDRDFISLPDLGIPGVNRKTFPVFFENRHCEKFRSLDHLPVVKSITVNRVHGNENSIIDTVNRFDPDVESMEGAAFAFSCIQGNIPYLQLRAVSNFVEKRNRESWNIPLALENLSLELNKFLRSL